MDRKAIFFDIDGTLYDVETGIPESTREGIKRLKDNGHIPVICTGRSKSYIAEDVLEMGFDGIIAGAGTYVEYNGEVIDNSIMDRDKLKELDHLLEKWNAKYIMEGPRLMYYNPRETDEEYIERVHKWNDVITLEPFDYRTCEINKFSCFFHEDDNKDDFVSEMQKDYHVIVHDNMPFTEVLPKGVSKATGIEKLIKAAGILKENTYAFGDSNNDLEMLEFVAYGIAMGNSNDNVLNTAEYITKPLREHGIFEGLKRFHLI